jgi:hypothetical protein
MANLPPPCGPDRICCAFSDLSTACQARAMGCPPLRDNPAGSQLCTTTAECVVPGDVCAFPEVPGISWESCFPSSDESLFIIDSGASDDSDGGAEASIVDAAAKDDGG